MTLRTRAYLFEDAQLVQLYHVVANAQRVDTKFLEEITAELKRRMIATKFLEN